MVFHTWIVKLLVTCNVSVESKSVIGSGLHGILSKKFPDESKLLHILPGRLPVSLDEGVRG